VEPVEAAQMTVEDSTSLIMKEAFDEDGLVVGLRAGADPGSDRVSRLLQALKVLFDSNSGKSMLDRRLAGALFGIAYSIQSITCTRTPANSWSKEFMEIERDQICCAVESVFYDQWITPDM
jgi:hypothetical protein